MAVAERLTPTRWPPVLGISRRTPTASKRHPHGADDILAELLVRHLFGCLAVDRHAYVDSISLAIAVRTKLAGVDLCLDWIT
jgi:hypothetical protein